MAIGSSGKNKMRPMTGLKRVAKYSAMPLFAVAAFAAYVVSDDLKTLRSLRRIEGTNAYVMDYYCDYHMETIRRDGLDRNDVEATFIDAFFPTPIDTIARRVRRSFVPRDVELDPDDKHHCTTVVSRSANNETIFGRNFDWENNAALVLRVHREGSIQSLAVIDLAYLNLDRPDLDRTSLWRRIPLLFAPYYVMDGMNRSGVAISGMSVAGAQPPLDREKPDLIHSTAMRLVLDYCESTEEAIELIDQYNIHFAGPDCHLMIADAEGDSAIVEFIDGQTKVLRTETDWQVCTNFQVWGASEQRCDQLCGRYQTASMQLDKLEGTPTETHIMQIMESVAVDDWTMWTSVYHLSKPKLLFRHRKSPAGEPKAILFE